MTTNQLYLFNGLYLIILVVVAVLTRATGRRIAGALAGGAVNGVVALGISALGEEMRWWHMAISWEPHFLTLAHQDCPLWAVSGLFWISCRAWPLRSALPCRSPRVILAS